MEVASIKNKKWRHERTFLLNVDILLYYRFLLNKRFDRRKELGRKPWMHFDVIFLRFSSVLLSRERAWPYMASLLAIKVGFLGRQKAAQYWVLNLHSSLAGIYQTIARLRETRFAATYVPYWTRCSFHIIMYVYQWISTQMMCMQACRKGGASASQFFADQLTLSQPHPVLQAPPPWF